MSEVSKNILNELFTSGITREEFIDKYKKISSSEDKPDNILIFNANMDDNSIGAVFDSVKLDKTGLDEDSLTEKDVKNLAALDGNNEEISDEDLNILVKQMYENYQKSAIAAGSVDSDEQSMTPSQGMDLLNALKILKTQQAESKKIKIQSEIDNLVQNDTNISKNLQDEYRKAKQNLETAQAQLKQKQAEYDRNQNDILSIKEQIARKQGEIEGSSDTDKQQSLQTEIHNLAASSEQYDSTSQSLSGELSSIQKTISDSKKIMSTVIDKIESSSSKTGKMIKEKQSEIEQIDIDLKFELELLDEQIRHVEELQLTSLTENGKRSAYYSDVASGTVSDGHVGKTAAQALSNATSQIGVRELTGHNDGKEIAKYRNGVNNNAAWCASFVS